MSEKEIVKKPRRPAKTQNIAPDKAKAARKSAAEKIVKSKKETAKSVEKIDSNDFVIDAKGELKPAKKSGAKRKTLIETPEKTAVVSVETVSPELSAVAGSELAEAIQTVEEIIGESPVSPDSAPAKAKPKRKTKSPAGKTKSVVSSSDAFIKETSATKIAFEAEKQKSEVSETAVSEADRTEVHRRASDETEAAAAASSNDSLKKEESPIFKELAEPKLPALPQENRAWLQMQSPSRIFFYWSTRQNPFETLKRAFPFNRPQNYWLTARLINETGETQEFYTIGDAGSGNSGSWWFNVDANSKYRVELGLYAPNRPFIRLMSSNTIETPRSAPSSNRDWSMDFTVSANQFAEVLDASGYTQDAFEVAIAGDDPKASGDAARQTFFQLTGSDNPPGASSDDLRSALVALAAGEALNALRERVGKNLYAALETIFRDDAEKLSADKVLAALQENFGFAAEEGDETEEYLTPVFGASSINFPKKLRAPRVPHISSFR